MSEHSRTRLKSVHLYEKFHEKVPAAFGHCISLKKKIVCEEPNNLSEQHYLKKLKRKFVKDLREIPDLFYNSENFCNLLRSWLIPVGTGMLDTCVEFQRTFLTCVCAQEVSEFLKSCSNIKSI